jgi:hypothetical protein
MSTHHPRLLLLADEALRKGMEIASQEELRGPVLVLQDALGEVHRYRITLPSVHPSDVMKVLLLAHRATHAAICLEGWGVKMGAPEGNPDRDEALRRGRRPKGMPEPRLHPDRRDVLILMAQSRGQDTGIYRQWTIEGTNPRRMIPDSEIEAGGFDLAPSRFWPMYVPFADVEDVVRHHAGLARLRDQMHGRRS